MSTGTGNRSTAGFTLLELLVVVVIGALILGAAFQVLAVQERSYRQQSAAMTTQQNVRAALDVLETELREISASDGDLLMIQPESLTFRAYRAAGFICDLRAASSEIVVLQRGTEPFVAGKQKLLYFIEGLQTTGTDDVWGLADIDRVDDGGTCAATWGGLEGVDTTTLKVSGFTFPASLGGPPVYLGAPVRSFEVFTYGLFEIDGEPVLARRSAVDGRLDPIVGPLAPSPNGLVFRYFDGNGLPTTNPANVARIGIVVRGRTKGTGVPGQTHYTDSLVTQLFLRNN
mgnify:CR=1 FL=1